MPPATSSSMSLDQLAALREARRSLEIAAATPPQDVFRSFRVSDEMLRYAQVEIPKSGKHHRRQRVFDVAEESSFAVYYRRVEMTDRLEAKWTAMAATASDKLRDIASKMDAQRQRYRRR